MTTDLFLNIDAASINWARAQFALTAIYHWLFVPLTLGLAVIMGIAETCWYRTRNTFWRDTAQFWQRLFGINFAMGVATGIILEFEFGTNWSNYSWFVGDIFGAPLAIEGIVAFFMESTFVAVMYFGWKKVSPGFHLASTWLTGLGATISAWWILVANAWMQNPVGCEFNPDTMRNEMVDFFAVALSPFAIGKFCHTVISAWIIGAVFVVAVSCWYLMKRREERLAVESIKIAVVVGLIASLGAAFTGHVSGQQVAKAQPMKLAAMEALYNGGYDQGLTAIAWVNPFCQPDYEHMESAPLKIDMPYALSIMATNDPHGFVPGINDILNGYTRPDGSREPSMDEKIARGRLAISTLAEYRKLKQENGGKPLLSTHLTILKENMPYFGYGYVKDKKDVVPYVPVNFWAFRIMVGLGCLFILYFVVMVFLSFRIPYLSIIVRRLLATIGILPETMADSHGMTGLPAWHYWVAIALVPLAYIASESGWLVAEFGRQPWTIQDMLPTWVAVSDINGASVALTFFLFLFLFTLMLAVEISILLKQIKRGPEYTEK
ncbi:MAG: cytochrome ubiquinol oxidase subunit I [Prevotella sp.]|nr:cytochrome ubiquinol oxidase subunit I [Prevotella sp.]MBQ9186943.1 cytochrome ubiquinol oxidase subunit I [Prevotella sp.]